MTKETHLLLGCDVSMSSLPVDTIPCFQNLLLILKQDAQRTKPGPWGTSSNPYFDFIAPPMLLFHLENPHIEEEDLLKITLEDYYKTYRVDGMATSVVDHYIEMWRLTPRSDRIQLDPYLFLTSKGKKINLVVFMKYISSHLKHTSVQSLSRLRQLYDIPNPRKNKGPKGVAMMKSHPPPTADYLPVSFRNLFEDIRVNEALDLCSSDHSQPSLFLQINRSDGASCEISSSPASQSQRDCPAPSHQPHGLVERESPSPHSAFPSPDQSTLEPDLEVVMENRSNPANAVNLDDDDGDDGDEDDDEDDGDEDEDEDDNNDQDDDSDPEIALATNDRQLQSQIGLREDPKRRVPRNLLDITARNVSSISGHNAIFNSYLTTDGCPSLCALQSSCPPNCNCALQVDREDRKLHLWSDMEKIIFLDKFMQFPNNFSKIAAFLTNRTTKDCVKFYYDSKTTIPYKSLLRYPLSMGFNGDDDSEKAYRKKHMTEIQHHFPRERTQLLSVRRELRRDSFQLFEGNGLQTPYDGEPDNGALNNLTSLVDVRSSEGGESCEVDDQSDSCIHNDGSSTRHRRHREVSHLRKDMASANDIDAALAAGRGESRRGRHPNTISRGSGRHNHSEARSPFPENPGENKLSRSGGCERGRRLWGARGRGRDRGRGEDNHCSADPILLPLYQEEDSPSLESISHNNDVTKEEESVSLLFFSRDAKSLPAQSSEEPSDSRVMQQEKTAEADDISSMETKRKFSEMQGSLIPQARLRPRRSRTTVRQPSVRK